MEGDRSKSAMKPQRKELLDAIGFVWGTHKDAWEKNYGDLLVFVQHHGHGKVPSNYPPNPKLAVWAKRQRREYKLHCDRLAAGQPSKNDIWIHQERYQRLKNAGFVFENRKEK